MNVLGPSHNPLCGHPVHTAWDNLTCTKGVVSVSRGDRAVMDCNISNPVSHVTICLNVPGSHCRTIFNVTAPGHVSQDGWQLRVLEGTVQLVTEEAQATQAGKYKWRLKGGQLSAGTTVLNVSGEGPDEDAERRGQWEGRGGAGERDEVRGGAGAEPGQWAGRGQG